MTAWIPLNVSLKQENTYFLSTGFTMLFSMQSVLHFWIGRSHLRNIPVVRAAFHQEFIRTGLLDEKWGKFYDQLFEDRQEGDYLALISFEPEYVSSQLDQCRQFIDVLRPLITPLK